MAFLDKGVGLHGPCWTDRVLAVGSGHTLLSTSQDAFAHKKQGLGMRWMTWRAIFTRPYPMEFLEASMAGHYTCTFLGFSAVLLSLCAYVVYLK